ncbi:putative hydrolase [Tanacetum coccineum]
MDVAVNQQPLSNGKMNSSSSSALIFLGTGCSSAVPNAMCLIQPSDPPCHVCHQSLSLPPERNPNYSSLLVSRSVRKYGKGVIEKVHNVVVN